MVEAKNPGYLIDEENHAALLGQCTTFPEAAGEGELPKAVDPEAWGLRIEMQGSMSSCTGHMLSTGMEILIHWEHGVDVQLSRLYAYLMAQQTGGYFGADRGATIFGAMEAGKKGVCLESVCPYPTNYQYPGASWRPTPAMVDNSKLYKIGASVNIKDQPDPWKAAMQWVGAYGVLLFGIPWAPPINSDGIVTQWSNDGSGGHALCGGGYIPLSNQEDAIKIPNSHSDRYGKRGYLYLRQREFEKAVNDRSVTILGVTSCSSPTRKVRSWDGATSLMA